MTDKTDAPDFRALQTLLPFIVAVGSAVGSYTAIKADLTELRATVIANSKLDDLDRASVQRLEQAISHCPKTNR